MLCVNSRGLAAIVACAASFGASTALADPAMYRHRAQAGDTLIALGQSLLEHPSDWPEVQKLNHIRNPPATKAGAA